MSEAAFTVIIPAAGSGSRFGGGVQADKLLEDVAGHTVLQRAVGLFADRADVAEIIIVTQPERFDVYREHLAATVKNTSLLMIGGGRERWESVLFGLRAAKANDQFVAIHDAARPLTPRHVIDEAFAAAIKFGGSVPGLPEPATLKRMGDGALVAETVDRRGLYQAQTPQCFHREKLLQAYEALLKQNKLADVTDDAQVFERVGLAVRITAGSALNLKVTRREDVTLAAALAKETSG